MSSKEIQKSDFIRQIHSKSDKKNPILKEFIENFYKHVSLGYLKNLAENISHDILTEIATLAFEVFNTSPTPGVFHLKHHVLEKEKLQ